LPVPFIIIDIVHITHTHTHAHIDSYIHTTILHLLSIVIEIIFCFSFCPTGWLLLWWEILLLGDLQLLFLIMNQVTFLAVDFVCLFLLIRKGSFNISSMYGYNPTNFSYFTHNRKNSMSGTVCTQVIDNFPVLEVCKTVIKKLTTAAPFMETVFFWTNHIWELIRNLNYFIVSIL